MAPHFCCCLPIRLGAFIITFISLVIGLFVGGVSWAGLYYNGKTWKGQDGVTYSFHLTTKQKIIVIALGAVYTLYFLISLFGLIGVIIKRINFVRTFSAALKFFLAIITILSIVNTVFLFVDRDAECTLGSTKNQNCVKSSGLSFGAVIAIVIVADLIPILFIAYASWIISDCVTYLEDQHIGSRNVGMYPFSQPYNAVRPTDDLNHPYNKPYDSHA